MFNQTTPKNKVFVGGFPVHLDENHLKQYMNKYGEVLACKILRKNGHSRGFGFVTFAEPSSAKNVIELSHQIEGKNFDCKPLMSEKDAKCQSKDQKKRKIFVGGISKSVTEDMLLEYFSQYGAIERVVINREHYTDKSRGSGFVLFKSPKSAKKVLENETPHILAGKEFDCQPCLLQEEIKKMKETTSSQANGTSSRSKMSETSSTKCSKKSSRIPREYKQLIRQRSGYSTELPYYQGQLGTASHRYDSYNHLPEDLSRPMLYKNHPFDDARRRYSYIEHSESSSKTSALQNMNPTQTRKLRKKKNSRRRRDKHTMRTTKKARNASRCRYSNQLLQTFSPPDLCYNSQLCRYPVAPEQEQDNDYDFLLEDLTYKPPHNQNVINPAWAREELNSSSPSPDRAPERVDTPCHIPSSAMFSDPYDPNLQCHNQYQSEMMLYNKNSEAHDLQDGSHSHQILSHNHHPRNSQRPKYPSNYVLNVSGTGKRKDYYPNSQVRHNLHVIQRAQFQAEHFDALSSRKNLNKIQEFGRGMNPSRQVLLDTINGPNSSDEHFEFEARPTQKAYYHSFKNLPRRCFV